MTIYSSSVEWWGKELVSFIFFVSRNAFKFGRFSKKNPFFIFQKMSLFSLFFYFVFSSPPNVATPTSMVRSILSKLYPFVFVVLIVSMRHLSRLFYLSYILSQYQEQDLYVSFFVHHLCPMKQHRRVLHSDNETLWWE